MPDPRNVSILKRDGSQSNYYETYALARAAAITGDVIRIWADLSDEQILLMDKVDIWIAPGVIIKMTSSDPVIVDNSDEYTEAVNCRIYGFGIIKNTNSSSGNCIVILNENSSLIMECDYIEGESGVSIMIFPSKKFHLKCNKVTNKKFQAISIGQFASSGMVEDVNLDIKNIETGDSQNLNTGTTALTVRCNGFIKIEEILCRNVGHCILHQEGSVFARIKKMTTVMNTGNSISTVNVSQGTGDQKLVLYFDEIINKFGTSNASLCIEHHQGSGVFIGRKVISISNNLPNFIAAIQISKEATNDLPKGYFKINEIISTGGVAMVLNDFNEQITIDSEYIESNGSVVIYSSGSTAEHGNFFIRNAKIKNISESSSAKGIFFENIYPIATLYNVKIVSGSDNGSNIFLSNGISIDVYNYGLFGNEGIDGDKIKLKIGTWTEPEEDYNYQYFIDPLLS